LASNTMFKLLSFFYIYVVKQQLTIYFKSSKPIQIGLCIHLHGLHLDVQHSVDTVAQWREDWSSASVVNHTIVTDPTIR